MREAAPRILQVNTLDARGGAATVALGLHRAYRKRGLDARLAVGSKTSEDPTIFAVPNDESRSWGSRALLRMEGRIRASGASTEVARWARRGLFVAGDPARAWEMYRGLEPFSFPGAWRLLDRAGPLPSVIHCHNLHGSYFDLRALTWLSLVAPVVVTLHDAWLLSGHCAHSLGCERWRTGCGACPDLTLPPALARDTTAQNWRRKQRIFERSRLHVAAPSQWILDRARQSMLAPAIRGARVIPNGVDLEVFRPGDRYAARLALGLPESAKVLSFVADSTQNNPYKDWRTQIASLELLAARGAAEDLVFLAIGGVEATARIGPIEVRHLPYTSDPRRLALYYQAADVHTHAARAETFPLVVLEALASGTPVVASRVGGIPEMILHGRTGLTVAPGDAEQFANAIEQLLSDPARAAEMGANGARDARERFGLERHVAAYLDFYREARADFASGAQSLARGRAETDLVRRTAADLRRRKDTRRPSKIECNQSYTGIGGEKDV